MSVTESQVHWAYKTFLDREPENNEVVQAHMHLASLEVLCEAFLRSFEYQNRKTAVIDYSACPPLDIDLDLTPEQEKRIFDMTSQAWQKMGAEEPHWSVLTNPKFKQDRIDNSLDEFYASGEHDLVRLYNALRRNSLEPRSYRSIIEIGCGVGRVTSWFMRQFEQVYAYDISPQHIALAQEACKKISDATGSVTFSTVSSIEDYQFLPKSDLVYSILVLQHNPPPVIKSMLGYMFDALRPGGVAFFQIPVYAPGYNFSYAEYLKSAGQGIEMHCLPQGEIFDIADSNHCIPIELLNITSCTGFGLAYTFLFMKKV